HSVTDSFIAMSMTAASGAFAWTVHQFFERDMTLTGMAAAILLLFAIQLRGLRSRLRQMHVLKGGIEELRSANSAIRLALEDTKRKVAEVTFAIARKSDAQERKMAGELHIIEDLVRSFASNI